MIIKKLNPIALVSLLYSSLQLGTVLAEGDLSVSFAPPASFPTGGGFGGSSQVVGDINRDGKPDVAVTIAGMETNGIAVLLGNGDGTFQNALITEVAQRPSFLVMADFNRDGKLDIAGAELADFSGFDPAFGRVWVLLGNGDGTFQSPVGYAAGSYCSSL